MMNRKLALGFAGWREGWQWKLGKGRSASNMSRALGHFVNRELSRGYLGWAEYAADLAYKRASMRRGLSHMLNRKLSAGLNAWVEMVAMKAEFMQLLRKGLSFMIHRKLAMAWGRWRSTRSLSPHSLRGARHFANRKLSLGWNAWVEFWRERTRKADAMRRGLKHMLTGGSRAASTRGSRRALRLEFMQLLRKGSAS